MAGSARHRGEDPVLELHLPLREESAVVSESRRIPTAVPLPFQHGDEPVDILLLGGGEPCRDGATKTRQAECYAVVIWQKATHEVPTW